MAPVLTWAEAAKSACDGLTTKQQAESNCGAVQRFLKGEALWVAKDKFHLLLKQADLDAAGRVWSHAVTGVKPDNRQGKIPLPDDCHVYALGLEGKTDMSLIKWILRYVGHAIDLNGEVPAVVRMGPGHGRKFECLILCAATHSQFVLYCFHMHHP